MAGTTARITANSVRSSRPRRSGAKRLAGSGCPAATPWSASRRPDSSPWRAGAGSPDNIAYVAAATRVADALTQDVLLAPIESSVIPLPHQIRALSRAIANDRVRYLLADEVGLGKTIEAGLIMRELKLRGLVKRTLVIAPKGLVSQWVAEMRTHFNEYFSTRLTRRYQNVEADICRGLGSRVTRRGSRRPPVARNAWTMFSQVVVPMDSVKPLEKRRGWSASPGGRVQSRTVRGS